MTVRELVNHLTQPYVDWDREIKVCVAKEEIKSENPISWKAYEIDRFSLFTPDWYEGDRCILMLKS